MVLPSEQESLDSIAKTMVKLEKHIDQITDSLDALQTHVYRWLFHQSPHLFDND